MQKKGPNTPIFPGKEEGPMGKTGISKMARWRWPRNCCIDEWGKLANRELGLPEEEEGRLNVIDCETPERQSEARLP